VGPVGAAGADGIVGVDLAHLPGARQVTRLDATHGTFGARWYGDEAVIDRWWSVALDAWRGALDARIRVDGPQEGDDPAPLDQSAGGSGTAPRGADGGAVPAILMTFRGSRGGGSASVGRRARVETS